MPDTQAILDARDAALAEIDRHIRKAAAAQTDANRDAIDAIISGLEAEKIAVDQRAVADIGNTPAAQAAVDALTRIAADLKQASAAMPGATAMINGAAGFLDIAKRIKGALPAAD